MFGHTLAGTFPHDSLPDGDPLPEDAPFSNEPLSAKQPPKACCWESQPANCGSPAAEQVTCDDSAHRRNASTTAAQEGVIEAVDAQFIEQSVLPEEQPACAILAQMVVHEAESWAAEQLPPQEAKGPSSRAPPHPIADESAINAAA
jgi:hypothetical protein